ncbi:MAG: methyl-accepting chemotaxis protein [Deltaproteobacteria bacterium]|nr:methyl-accepting chemotaxis protein [Deltaproteobacteria bacterium]
MVYANLLTKIKWRVIFSTTILFSTGFLISAWINVDKYTRDYLRDVEKHLELLSQHENMRVVEVNGEEELGEGVWSMLQMTAETSEGFSQFRVFDRDGTVIVEAGKGSPIGKVGNQVLEMALKNYSGTLRSGENYESIVPIGKKKRYFLNASIPVSVLKGKTFSLWRESAVVLGLSVLIYFTLAYCFLRKDIGIPLDNLVRHANRVAEGDISHDAEVRSRTEIGDLTIAFNKAIQGMRAIIIDVKGLLERVVSGTEEIGGVNKVIEEGTYTQAVALGQAGKSVEEFHKNIKKVSENLNLLSQLADDTSSSILEMTSSIGEVDGNVGNLTVSVGEVSSSIEEITTSLGEVARAIDALSASADETASSLSEIDASIKDIEGHTAGNARLSQEASKTGEKGLNAVKTTHEGMEKIKEAVNSISTIIDDLGKRSGEIGKILTVIDDVAEETNLLALNAAILAAQAGEHGRGFGIVAEEIRELAERTSSSTKEIDALIQGVQSQTQKAITSVKVAEERVDEGERLSQETITVLMSILERFKQSQEMSQLVARATQEQARGTRGVTQAIQMITETIHQIARATQEQSQGGQQIMRAVERMKGLNTQVSRATGEQTKASKVMAGNTERVTSSARQIKDFVSLQKGDFESIVETINKNQDIMRQSQRSVERLNTIVTELKQGVNALNGKIGVFKLEGTDV